MIQMSLLNCCLIRQVGGLANLHFIFFQNTDISDFSTLYGICKHQNKFWILLKRANILKVFFQKVTFCNMLFSCAVHTVFYGQILCMTCISARLEFNFFIEIKSGLFCVCVLVLCCLSGSTFLSYFFISLLFRSRHRWDCWNTCVTLLCYFLKQFLGTWSCVLIVTSLRRILKQRCGAAVCSLPFLWDEVCLSLSQGQRHSLFSSCNFNLIMCNLVSRHDYYKMHVLCSDWVCYY